MIWEDEEEELLEAEDYEQILEQLYRQQEVDYTFGKTQNH